MFMPPSDEAFYFCWRCQYRRSTKTIAQKKLRMIMKTILSSMAVAAVLLGGVARAQNADASRQPVADPAAMKAALDGAVAKGEIAPGDAAEMAKIVDLVTAEQKAEEIRNRLRAIEELEARGVTQQR
jgi:hypothetical protein